MKIYNEKNDGNAMVIFEGPYIVYEYNQTAYNQTSISQKPYHKKNLSIEIFIVPEYKETGFYCC